VNGIARHLLHFPVARDAQAQKLLRSQGFNSARAELRGNRKIKRELRNDGGFPTCAIADHIKRLPEFLYVELHGPSSIIMVLCEACPPAVNPSTAERYSM
jgi:hypothetical protein